MTEKLPVAANKADAADAVADVVGPLSGKGTPHGVSGRHHYLLTSSSS
jgi:hypothetical protein